jgi:ABC-type sugar transport system substrate-binding protein
MATQPTERAQGSPLDHADATRRQFLGRAAASGVSVSALSALLAACGSSSSSSSTAAASGSAAPAGKVKLKGVSEYIPAVTSLASADRGFEWGIQGLGGKFMHTAYSDVEDELSGAQSFGNLGANGATSYLVSDASVVPYAESLASQKITYFNYANRVPWKPPSDPRYNGYFLTSSNGSFAEEAYIVAGELFKRGGGSGTAIMLRGAEGSASDAARSFGTYLRLAEHPNIKIVATAFTDWNQVTAQQQTATLLTSHPNPTYLLAMNDSIALGGLASLRAANAKDTLVMGCDGDPEYIKQMTSDNRIVATAAGRLDHTGVLAAVWLFDKLNGYKFNPLESYINTDSVIVDTPAAAQAMLNLIGFAPHPLPYDPVKMSRVLQGNNWDMPHRVEVADPANFDWGSAPGVNHHPKPSGFSWPSAYESAMNAGQLDKLNAEYATHLHDIYGAVRAKATYKSPVLGTFAKVGYTKPGVADKIVNDYLSTHASAA